MRVKNFFFKIPKFFSEVKQEMRKVSWPTKKEALIDTLIVILVSVIFAIFLGGLDALFTWLMKKII